MKLNDLCKRVYNGIEKNNSKILECITFCIFCFLIILISFFHEPWFDEFQAWGISKDSLYNILFVMPHYEGHPPLWYLIIKCFSIFNINAELCIKIPNILLILLGTWFVIFKSPFPRIIRVLLPFTYFMFYQYGIISRPYSLFYVAIILCAYFFNTRNSNPFRYVCILALLTLSSAYGLAIAACITIAWGFEQLDLKKLKQSFINLLKSKQFKAMLLLFVFCVLITIEIFPSQKNTAISLIRYLPVWQKIIYCFFGTIADATMFDIIVEHDTMANIFSDCLRQYYYLFAIFFGLFILIFLIRIMQKSKMVLYFVLPYFILSGLFMIYYYSHHIGLLYLIIVFCLWISYDKILSRLTNTELGILKILSLSVIFVQLCWNLGSCVGDILFNYETSREMANYIKKHKLYNYKLYSGGWSTHYYVDMNGNNYFNEYVVNVIDKMNDKKYQKKDLDIHNMYLAVIVNPYFKKNIFYNFNANSPEKCYALHQSRGSSETKQIIEKWKEQGVPDVILGHTKLNYVWKNAKQIDDYILVKNFYYYSMWKGIVVNEETPVPLYMSKELYKKLGFSKYQLKKD